MGTHWKKLRNTMYIGAWDFEPGEEKIGTIKDVTGESVMNQDGKKEDRPIAHFQEPYLKPMVLNATNCKTISNLYKTPYIENWIGKQIIMRVQKIKAFGVITDAVTVKPEIPKAAPKQPAPKAAAPTEYLCAECGQVLQPFGQMDVAQLAQYTTKKYGKCLCADCAKGAADKAETAQEA